MTTPLVVTFDECDLDEEAMKHARRKAFSALIAKGVTDLNTLPAEMWDYFGFVFLLNYHNALAARNHGFAAINWRLSYKGEEIPG